MTEIPNNSQKRMVLLSIFGKVYAICLSAFARPGFNRRICDLEFVIYLLFGICYLEFKSVGNSKY